MSVIKNIDEFLIERGPSQDYGDKDKKKSRVHQKAGKKSGMIRRFRKAAKAKKADTTLCPTCGKKL